MSRTNEGNFDTAYLLQLDNKGQLTIKKRLREESNISPGDYLRVYYDKPNQRICIERVCGKEEYLGIVQKLLRRENIRERK